tara:strand:- start:1818 stop:2528 length:711 start_codon:yes stop_codon:yes gene_type:complete
MNSIPLETNQKWWWYKAKSNLLNFIIRKNIKVRDLKILEIGPGLGNNVKTLNRYGLLDILEIDKNFYTYLKKNYKSLINNFYSDVNELKDDYDLIVMLDVLEHIEYPKAFLKKLNNNLHKNGNIIIGVPAYKALWSVHDERLEHFRRYKWKSLKDHTKIFRFIKGYGFNYLLLPIRYIQIRFSKKVDSTNETNKVVNDFLYLISIIEHSLRTIGINPKIGISIYGIFSKNKTSRID